MPCVPRHTSVAFSRSHHGNPHNELLRPTSPRTCVHLHGASFIPAHGPRPHILVVEAQQGVAGGAAGDEAGITLVALAIDAARLVADVDLHIRTLDDSRRSVTLQAHTAAGQALLHTLPGATA